MPADWSRTHKADPVAGGTDDAADGTPPVPPPAVTTPHDGPVADAPPGFAAVAPEGYVIEAELDHGGMGVVYRGRQLGLNRACALKMMLAPGSGAGVLRFLAEAEAIAAVEHPQVVQVYGFGRHAAGPYLAMEFCPGGTLTQRLAAGRLSPAAAAVLLAGLAEAVGAAHARGIVHRDLKPGNVLFDAAGVAKVADFGLAKRAGGADLTRTEALMGTPAYMSPEQAKGEAKFAGPPSDVWALGVILYECLTGARPFTGGSSLQVMDRVVEGEPVGVRALAPEVPRDLDLIVRKCLRKEPHERYPTAAELAADLRRLLAGEPVTARPVPAAVRAWKWVRRNPGYAGLWAGLAAALLVGAGSSLAFGLRADRAARLADAAKTDALDRAAEARDQAALARREADRADLEKRNADAKAAEAGAELRRANEVTDVLGQMFQSTDPFNIFSEGILPAEWEKQRGMTAGDFLKEAAGRLEGKLTDQPVGRARVLTALGNNFRNSGLFPDAERLLVEAQTLRRQALPAGDLERAAGERTLGQLRLDQGDFLAALELFQTAAAVYRAAPDAEGEALLTGLFEAWAEGMLHREESVEHMRAVVAGDTRRYGPTHPRTLLARLGEVALLLEFGRALDCLPLLGPVLQGIEAQPDGQLKALAKALVGSQFAMVGATMAPDSPVALKLAESAYQSSERAAGAALPGNSIYLSVLRYQIAILYGNAGRHADCERMLVRVLDGVRQSVGLAHPRALMALANYATILTVQGRAAEARPVLVEAERAMAERYGGGSLWHASAVLIRVSVECAAGEPAAAAALAERVLAGGHARLVGTPLVIDGLDDAARSLRRADRTDARKASVGLLQLARRLEAETGRPDQAREFRRLGDEAHTLMVLGRSDEAQPVFAAAERIAADPTVKLADQERGFFQTYRARLAERDGALGAAEAGFREALRLAGRHAATGDTRERVLAAEELAGFLIDRGRAAEAVPFLEAARKAALANALPVAVINRAAVTNTVLATAISHLAAARLRAGDAAGYRAAVTELHQRFRESTDSSVLTAVAWAVGLAPDPPAWDVRTLADRLSASRNGLPPNAEAKVLHVRLGGPPPSATKTPLDQLLRGLAAADRNGIQRAMENVKVMSPDRPNPDTLGDWPGRLAAAILADELRARLAVERAPPPRPVR